MVVSKSRPIAAVILAAGEGKRMKSGLPKVLHLLGGVPLVERVCRTAADLGCEKIVAVVPPEDRAVSELLGSAAVCVRQTSLLGTGDALLRSRPLLKDFDGDLVVLCGDVPLLTSATLRQLIKVHREAEAAATVLTARLTNPAGYGRIIRRTGGEVARIVEEVDADIYQKAVEEVNAGVYCFRAPEVWGVLEKIGNRNRQGEYYLPDAIALLVDQNRPIATCRVEDIREMLGINTRRDLARLEKKRLEKLIGRMQDEGVTVVLPETVYIEDEVRIGRDTVIYPSVFIERGTRIGANCRVGPFVYLPADTVLEDNSRIKNNVLSRSLKTTKK